jgi:hypothetical protein
MPFYRSFFRRVKMSEAEIRSFATERGFHPQTLKRWLNWAEADRDALLSLASNLKIGENHQRDMMDWLEEIAVRDHAKIQQILTSKIITDIESDPRLGRADKLKRIKEQIRRIRFPRLAETEDAIRARIQELKLHPGISVTVPPGLEGGKLNIAFQSSSHEELLKQIAKLAEAAEKKSITEIFDLLGGEPTRTSGSTTAKHC